MNCPTAWPSPPPTTRRSTTASRCSPRAARTPTSILTIAQKIEAEWKTVGTHRDATDKKFDQAILHTDNETAYVYLIGVIDAIYQAHRPYNVGGKAEQLPAFNVTFAVN